MKLIQKQNMLKKYLLIFFLGLQCINGYSFYQLESEIRIKSKSPDWDYLAYDQTQGRLFLSLRDDGVMVYDSKTKKIIAKIEDSVGANSTLLLPNFNLGYTFNGDGSSTVFNLTTLKKIKRTKIGNDADAGFFDPVTNQILVTMGDSHQATFLDAKTGDVVHRLNIDSSKLDGVVANGDGYFFMALRDKNAVIKINNRSHTIEGTWSTQPCEEPTSLALDSVHQRLMVGCRGKSPLLLIMDSKTGEVKSTYEIGRGNDGLIFDAEDKKVITTNGVDSNLIVYSQKSADEYVLQEAVTTRPYARTMAMDFKTKKIFTLTAEGVANPAKKINKKVSPFYPNEYYKDTFSILIYSKH